MTQRRRHSRTPATASAPPAPERATLGDYIRRQRELANVSLRKLSEQSGISAAVLREIESGLRHPSRTLLQSLAAGLRLPAETLYLQAGVLDPRGIEEAPAVRELRRDPYLTQRQREILVDVYSAFRFESRHRPER